MARPIDVRRIAEAIKGEGIDTRHWASHGTVGVVGDDGEFDPTNSQSVIVAPDGVWCDVLLQPSDIPVTARYQPGIGGGSCTVLAPIRPGDEVLVIIPDGNLMNPPAIVAVLNNQGVKIPIDPADNKPVFRNDRLSIFAKDVPIEIRTASGAKVLLQTDGGILVEPADGKHVHIGGDTGLEPAALGATLQSFIDDLIVKFNTHTHVVAGITTGASAVTSAIALPPLPPVPPDVTSSNVDVKV